MKQTITMTQKRTRCLYMRLYGLIMMILLTGFIGAQAQTVLWTPGFPKINPSPITVLDSSYVEVQFSVDANVTNARLDLTLPSGITRSGIPEALSGNTATIQNTTGNTITLGNLTNTSVVYFRIPITASCAATSGSAITVKVNQNSTTVIDTQPITIALQKPALNVNIPTNLLDFSTALETKTFSINLNSLSGNLSDFKITLSANRYTGLKNFKIGTTLIPSNKITRTGINSGNDTVVTLILDKTFMTEKLSSTIQTLTVDAYPLTSCGTKTVTVNGWYPASAAAAAATPGTAPSSVCGQLAAQPQFTLRMPSAAGVPNILFTSRAFDAPYENSEKFCFDGVTPNFTSYYYINTSSISDAYNSKIYVATGFVGNSLGSQYLDIDNIYYTIEGQPEKKIQPEQIEVVTTLTSIARKVKPAFLNKPFAANCMISDPIPAGKTIRIRFGRINGQFYDETTPTTTLQQNYFQSVVQTFLSTTNECGDLGTLQNQGSSLTIGGPIIPTQPEPLSVRANQTLNTMLSGLRTGMASTTYLTNKTLEVFVQLPAWMTMDESGGTPIQWIASNTVDIWPSTYTAHGNNLYSIILNTNTNTASKFDQGFLKVFYKAGTCVSTTENITDTIAYWINFNTYTGSPTACRPTFEKLGLAFQQVTMLCKEDGAVLDNFYMQRLTKGYKDSNNAGAPDNGAIAPDNEIDHSLYMQSDTGHIVWKGHISATGAPSYSHLYALLTTEAPLTITTTGNNNYLVPLSSSMIFTVNGANRNTDIAYTRVDNNRCYIRYTGSTPLSAGDLIEIRLPFSFRLGFNDLSQSSTFKGELFVSNSASANPFNNPVDRHGVDAAYQPVKVRNLYPMVNGNRYNFNGNASQNVQIDAQSYYGNYFASPWHAKEYWPYVPTKYWIVIPKGYEVTSPSLTVDVRISKGTGNVLEWKTGNVTTCTMSNDTCFVDLKSIFDLNYNGSGSLTPGKLAVPDDYALYRIFLPIRATKGAVLGSTLIQSRLVLSDPRTGFESQGASEEVTFSYSGVATTLSSSVNKVTASTPQITLPVLSVGNPNTIAINNVWLYVEGNVSAVSINDGTTTTNGTGFEGRWIKVSDQIASGVIDNYNFKASYGGGTTSTDAFTIYTVSGYNSSWAPDITQPLNKLDTDHEGAQAKINIDILPASIGGQLSLTGGGTITYNTPQTLSSQIHAFSASGALYNAKMTITVPAGQQYIPGTAKLYYPSNMQITLAPAFESYLVSTLNADLTTDRTFDFDFTAATGNPTAAINGTGTQEEQSTVLTMNFLPLCDTELTGIRYSGILSGKSADSNNAVGTGNTVFSPWQYPTLSALYNFDAAVSYTSQKVVAPIDTIIKLNVDMTKISGATQNMNALDSVEIKMHKAFNIKTVTYGNAAFGTPVIGSNKVLGDVRTVHVSFNSTYYNTLPSTGVNTLVRYNVELAYNPAQYSSTDAEQIISASMISNQAFDSNCPPKSAVIGTGDTLVSIVTFNPYPTQVCGLDSAQVSIANTSSTYTYDWFKDKNLANLIESSDQVRYETTLPSSTDTLYVKVSDGADILGTVRYPYSTYASGTFNLADTTAICYGFNVDISTLVSNKVNVQEMKFYSDAIGTELASPIVSPLVETKYYVRSISTLGCRSLPDSIVVVVHALPVVTLVNDKTNDESCLNTDVTFTTESGMTSYVWNLGGATTTTSGGTSSSNTATLKWNTVGTKTVTVNYTDANGCNATAATSQQIAIQPSTAITTQPAVDPAIKLSNSYIIPGSIVNLSVVAIVTNPTYQWYKTVGGITTTLNDAGKYSGTTSANMTITNAYEAENGNYYVIVTGLCGNATSNPVTVIAVANQDATLSDLKVNGTTVEGFNPAKKNYMATITCVEEQVTIEGIPNNANITSITGNGTFHLEPGDNFFNIVILAQDMVTSMTYTVNVIRDCYIPKILKDLEDAVICVGDTHTFEIDVQGENLTYEWYYGLNRIMGANSNTYTVTNTELRDYERYSVIIRSNYQGFQASTYSNKVRLWVADQLPTHLRFSEYPNPAITGNTYHIKVDGYTDVTKYKWSYNKEGVSFSPQTGMAGENETWATFGTLSAGNGTLKVTMEHPCGTRELTQAITVKYPTGTDDVTATTVQVYPNPTSGILKVSGTEMNQQIRVLDVTGSLKGTYKSMEGTTTIDLTGYAKGTYMVQYNGKTYKVIKK